MAELSQAERDKLPAEDFAGPDRSFPITDQESVESAAHLVGKADDPGAVKAKIIAIARRKGLKLPDAWRDEDPKDRASAATETRSTPVLDQPQPQTSRLPLLTARPPLGGARTVR